MFIRSPNSFKNSENEKGHLHMQKFIEYNILFYISYDSALTVLSVNVFNFPDFHTNMLRLKHVIAKHNLLVFLGYVQL